MRTVDVVQYVPYFPPHMGGLETHAAQWAKRWVQQGYGNCLVATYDIGQQKGVYTQDGYTVVTIPVFELIAGFPVPKFRTRAYRSAHREIAQFGGEIVITRTRFFLSSLAGGRYARRRKMTRVHIEHGVDYVKLNTRWKNLCAWCYDQLFGRAVLRLSDKVIAISEGCKLFVQRFTAKQIPVIYRGVEFVPGTHRESTDGLMRLGYVGRLTRLKGIDLLLQVVAEIVREESVELLFEIVGDGEERHALEGLSDSLGISSSVHFLGYKDRTYLEEEFYPRQDICLNASWQEGLPTSVIEPLLAGCVVVATDVGGTKEISGAEDLLLAPAGNLSAYKEQLLYAINHSSDLAGKSATQVRKKFDRNSSISHYYDIFIAL